MTTTATVYNKMKRKDLKLVDPRLLVVSGLNPRTDFGDVEGLKKSIIENGFETPLTAYAQGDQWVIIAGHRRHKATMEAIAEGHDIPLIPIQARRKPTAEEFLFQTLLSNDGKTMNLIEFGETYKRLLNFNYSITEIAERVGKTYKHVSEMILVASSSKEVKELVEAKQISATMVAEIKTSIKDVEEAEEVIKEAVKAKPEAKKKVTKKDVQKVTNKVKKLVFTRKEVLNLLKQQRENCAKNAVNPQTVLETELVVEDTTKKKPETVNANFNQNVPQA